MKQYRARAMVGIFLLGIAVGGAMRKGFDPLLFGWAELVICTLAGLGLLLIFSRVPRGK